MIFVYYNQRKNELLVRPRMGMCALTYVLMGEL